MSKSFPRTRSCDRCWPRRARNRLSSGDRSCPEIHPKSAASVSSGSVIPTGVRHRRTEWRDLQLHFHGLEWHAVLGLAIRLLAHHALALLDRDNLPRRDTGKIIDVAVGPAYRNIGRRRLPDPEVQPE